MSTKSKNCPTAPKKQTREKPATPPPPPVPVFAKVPCQRDQRAYGLHLEQHSQRWIAGKLKCTQPTVLRGIRRMEKWLATTLPEDRGEYTATEKLRLALAKHERLMERLLKMSLREFRRSRKTIPMKKTISMKDGVDDKGEPVKIRTEEWNKPQIGRKGFIDAAAKISHETTVLAAGYLGQGNGSISMAEVMDPEERDRWDRMVTIRDAQIKELEESRRVHAAERNARVSDECSQVNQPQSNAVPACISQSLMPPTPPREKSASARPAPVSQVAEKEPAVNQETDHQVVATSDKPTACATPSEDLPPPTADSQTCITVPLRMDMEPERVDGEQRNARVLDENSGVNPPQGNANPACISQSLMHPAPSEPQYRWEDSFRQEALDFHCLKFGLPPATTDMATGIPDPFKMSPRMWMERGYPYQIYIDRDIPCDRRNPLDTMGVVKLACPVVVNPERW